MAGVNQVAVQPNRGFAFDYNTLTPGNRLGQLQTFDVLRLDQAVGRSDLDVEMLISQSGSGVVSNMLELDRVHKQ